MILKRFLIATVTLLMLGLIGWCIISEYTVRTMSASVVLYRLAGATEQAMSDETIRLMLLERIPVGTSDTNIVAFLEANGVERDRFTSGQFFRVVVVSRMAWYTAGDQSRERFDTMVTMVTMLITCRHCGSPDLTKYGIAPNRKQKYRCRTCGRQSRENPGSAVR